MTPREHGVELSAMTKSVCGALCGLAMLGLAQNALAADLGYLRGSEAFEPQFATYDRWSGFYFGGQAGYGNAQMDFTNAAQSQIAHILRETTVEEVNQISAWDLLGKADKRDVSWGGFVGYNGQWENAVIGVELNYNRTSLPGRSSGSLSRRVAAAGQIYDITVDAEASMNITDYGTLRGRAGWVMGRFMPYIMAGIAFGRVETTRSATLTALVTDPATGSSFVYAPDPELEIKATYAYGWAAGAGIDVALMQNVFLRGEFEWVRFSNLPDMSAQLFSGRVGAGLKF
jgi:outer membrane immunogenic protein